MTLRRGDDADADVLVSVLFSICGLFYAIRNT